MSERALNMFMDGILIGYLNMSGTGTLSFTYDEEYTAKQNPTPLSLSMPLRQRMHGNRVVLPFLQGLLPDNPLALESMANKYQVSANSPFALLEHVGHDVAGALQIISPEEISEDALADHNAMTPIDDEQLTTLFHNALAVYDNGTPMRGAQRMSLAGTQAKVGVAKMPGGQSWAIPQRGTPTTHIFKPLPVDAKTFPDSDIVELFCQRTLAEAGLNAAHTELWNSPDGSMRAIVSERYDRQQMPNGTYRRIHQEDLCQALSVPPSKKYQRQDGGPGIGQIGNLFATRLEPATATNVAERFLMAVTANAALLNTDAHAKNYSLMLSGSTVSLAPLYDVLSIGAFLEENEHPLFPMRLGKTFDLEQVFPETLTTEARHLQLPADMAANIINQVLTRLNTALDTTAESMAALDGTGIISRTVAAIRTHSSLLKAIK